MTFPLEPLVKIQNNVKENFLMMPFTEIAEIVLLSGKRVGRAIDNKYLQMKSPEPLVQNQNSFTEIVSSCPLPKSIRMFSLAEQHGFQS